MAEYEYTAKDTNGLIFANTYSDISDIRMLREQLGKMGHTLLKAKRIKDYTKPQRRVRQDEIVAFSYKFAGMYSAGISIVMCLEALEAQSDNPALRHIIFDIRQSVETGSTLKKAFEKYSNIFSVFFIGMIEAGESSGRLSETLEMSAVYLERQLELKRKVRSAFAYPVIVGIMCFLIIVSLMLFVIPIFSKLYDQLHIQLPGPTLALVTMSLVVRRLWWFILPVAGGLIFLVKYFYKSPKVKRWLDVFKLKVPVFAKLNRMVIVSRFMRTFAMLNSAGVSVAKAFDVAGLVANNWRVSQMAEELKESVESGNAIADSLKKYEIFPPIIIQFTATGEESGMPAKMINKAVDFLEKDIERSVDGLLLKLEPALTVIMGTIIGFMLLAVYLPIFDYMSHVK